MSGPITPVYSPGTSSISSADFGSVLILNKIFNLILSMISILQSVGASQASRLSLYSTWQKEYTDATAQIPTLVSGEYPFSSISSDKRGDLNRVNSNAIATLQNRQSVVSDDAKALQSNVNQSNDAVNQQSNLGTAILQELNTLIGAIFK